MNARNSIKKRKSIESEIQSIVGNHPIETSKDLRSFLFETLGISSEGLPRTKSGPSVSIKELKKIKERHRIIELLVEHDDLMHENAAAEVKAQDVHSPARPFQVQKAKQSHPVLMQGEEKTPLAKEDDTIHNKDMKKAPKEITDEELKVIIKGEYGRMAFLVSLVLIVVGFFWYAQYSYNANFIQSVASVPEAVNP